MKRFPHKTSKVHVINESAVIITESVEFREAAYNHILKRDFPKPLKFLVYIKGATAESLRMLNAKDIAMRRERAGKVLHQTEMSDILYMQYFIIDEERSIKPTRLFGTHQKNVANRS